MWGAANEHDCTARVARPRRTTASANDTPGAVSTTTKPEHKKGRRKKGRKEGEEGNQSNEVG